MDATMASVDVSPASSISLSPSPSRLVGPPSTLNATDSDARRMSAVPIRCGSDIF